FAANVREIVTTAKSKGERVVLMSFAHYIPENYTIEAFREKRLDYTAHLCPVELWGRPANVTATLAEHNAVIREIVAEHPDVIYVDQAALMPKSGKAFDDCCHLT